METQPLHQLESWKTKEPNFGEFNVETQPQSNQKDQQPKQPDGWEQQRTPPPEAGSIGAAVARNELAVALFGEAEPQRVTASSLSFAMHNTS